MCHNGMKIVLFEHRNSTFIVVDALPKQKKESFIHVHCNLLTAEFRKGRRESPAVHCP